MKSPITLLVEIANTKNELDALTLFNAFLRHGAPFPLWLTLPRNRVQFTLLHVAVSKQWPLLVERILEVNDQQDPVNQLKKDSLDQEGDTPSHIAALKSDWGLLQTLMPYYFPVMLLNNKRQSVLSLALQNGADPALLEKLYNIAMLQRCDDTVDEYIKIFLAKLNQRYPAITWSLPELESLDKRLLCLVLGYQKYSNSDPNRACQYYENFLRVLQILNAQIDGKILLSKEILEAMEVALHFCVDYAFVDSAISIMKMLQKIDLFDAVAVAIKLNSVESSKIQQILSYLNEKIRSMPVDPVIYQSLITLGDIVTDLYSLLLFLTDTPDFTVTTDLLLILLDSQKQAYQFFNFICTMVKPFFERTPQRLETICDKLITIYLNRSKFLVTHKKLSKKDKKELGILQTALYKLLTAVIAANKDHFTDVLRERLGQKIRHNETLLALWEIHGYIPCEAEKKVTHMPPVQPIQVAAAIAGPMTAKPLQPVTASRESVSALRSPSPNPTAEPWSSEDEALLQQQKSGGNKKKSKKSGGRRGEKKQAEPFKVPPRALSNTSSSAASVADSIAADSDVESTGAFSDLVPSIPVEHLTCHVNDTAQATIIATALPASLPNTVATSAEQKPSKVLNVAATPFQPKNIKIEGYPSCPAPFYINPADLQPGLPDYNFEQANEYRARQRLPGRFTPGMRRAITLTTGAVGYIQLVEDRQTRRLVLQLTDDQGNVLPNESIGIHYAPKHDQRVVTILRIAGSYFKLSANPLEQDWSQSNAIMQQRISQQMPVMLWHYPVPVPVPVPVFTRVRAPSLMQPPYG